LAVTDAAVLSSIVSATVVVVKHGKTRSAELKHTVERLAVAGRPIGGVIINGVLDTSPGYYYADYDTRSEGPKVRERPMDHGPMRPVPATAAPGPERVRPPEQPAQGPSRTSPEHGDPEPPRHG